MKTLENYQTLLQSIDAYLVRLGKYEIDEMEASLELERLGLLSDDQSHPGRPLRELLASLRDSNLLPKNIKQSFGSWKIKNPKVSQIRQQIFLF